jgi:hypothetical protein
MRVTSWIWLVLVSIINAACQTVPALSCDQYCSLDSMVCDGKTSGTSYGSGVGYDWKSGSSYSTSVNTNSTNFHCRRPSTDDERAKVSKNLEDAQQVQKKQAEVKNTNTALGLGFGGIGGISLLILLIAAL